MGVNLVEGDQRVGVVALIGGVVGSCVNLRKLELEVLFCVLKSGFDAVVFLYVPHLCVVP